MAEELTEKAYRLERNRIALERYKATLGFRRSIIVGGFVAVAIALIPPLFQLVSYLLEMQTKAAERAEDIQKFRSQYVSVFLDNALNQDIELRIRLAEYFKFVAPDGESQDSWSKYYDALQTKRNTTRASIEELEAKLAAEQAKPQQKANLPEQNKLIQELKWLRDEVGYVAPDKSVITDPRNTDGVLPDPAAISLEAVPPERREIAKKIIYAFANAGFGKNQQVAALADAFFESGLDPAARNPVGNSVGLFQLLQGRGFGAGYTAEQLMDPDVNISIMIAQAKQSSAFVNATTLESAVTAFVRYIQRQPGNDILARVQAKARSFAQ